MARNYPIGDFYGKWTGRDGVMERMGRGEVLVLEKMGSRRRSACCVGGRIRIVFDF